MLIRDILLKKNPAQTELLIGKAQDNQDNINSLRADYGKVLEVAGSEEQKTTLKEWDQARSDYHQARQTVLDLARSQHWEDAEKQLFSVVAPIGDHEAQAVQDLVGLQIQSAKAAATDNTHGASQATLTLVVMCLAGIGLALGLGTWLSSRITQPLRLMSQAAAKIAQGDLTETVAYASADEIGALADALRAMSNSVKALVRDSATLAAAAVNGQLDVRADASLHAGDYRRVIEGLNQTFEELRRPLDLASSVLDQLAMATIPIQLLRSTRESTTS